MRFELRSFSELPEVASLRAMQNGDGQQAEYFRQLLDERKSGLCEQLEAELYALASFQRAGSPAGVRRHKRVVKALECELRTIDRLMMALRLRLGLPTLRRTL